MPYCPKCGVEVDDDVRQCPLCAFPIPDTRDEGDVPAGGGAEDRYPVPSNIYNMHRQAVRYQIFFVFATVAFSAMIVLAVIRGLKPELADITEHVFAGVLSSVMYMFFLLGFLKRIYSISGVFLTTVLLTRALSMMGEDGSWFLPLGLPIILWVFLNVAAFDLAYSHSRKKDRVGYMPTFALLFSSSICLGIDGIVSLHIHGAIGFDWSIIVAASCLAVALVLQAVVRILPERLRQAISRKMHF